MAMPTKALDDHLKTVYEFICFLLKSGLNIKDLGITYSTLMGHYFSNISDINIVVYGKDKFWKLMKYLEDANHPMLRWKNDQEWMEFHNKRNRYKIFSKEAFLRDMKRKKSEGFFNNALFIIFAAEEENEVWFKWGSEKYETIGQATVEGIVINDYDSIVRPGCYEIKDSKIIEGKFNAEIKKIVFYSRDYCMLAKPGEKIMACGILEKVVPKKGEVYHRIVVGYFDSYISDRREKEFIKTV